MELVKQDPRGWGVGKKTRLLTGLERRAGVLAPSSGGGVGATRTLNVLITT